MKGNEEFSNVLVKNKENKHRNFLNMIKLISMFFDNEITRSDLIQMDITEIYGILYDIMYSIDSTVHKKLHSFCGADKEIEASYKSRYDDLDADMGIKYDEFGNVIFDYQKKEEEKNRFDVYKECIEFIFRKSVELGNNNINSCYKSNLLNLIDSTEFLINNFETSMKYRELESKKNSLSSLF